MMQRLLAPVAIAIAAVSFATPARSAAPDGLKWDLSATQIATSCAAALKRAGTRIDAIVRSRSPRTFANVVLPLENVTADLNDGLVAQTFLVYVSPDKAVRDASDKCQTDYSNFYNAASARPDLEAAVAAVAKNGSAKGVYDKKLTALWLTALKRSGAGLNAADRAEFVKLSNQLADLGSSFERNIAEDTTTVTFSPAQTSGIPADFIATFKKDANGNYIVPVNESTAGLSAYANDESARKLYALAYANRAADKNVAILETALGVRDRLAHLMGYETWAAYQLADRMAGNPARVQKFLSGLDAAILPKARAEIANLRALKAADTRDPDAVLNTWDVGHYDNILNKTQYAVDTDAIRQYFPVQHTIDAVLDIYHTMLGIDFSQVKPSDAWVPDVLEYKVTDGKTHRLLGYTYFDLFPRQGKFQHFANWPLVPYRKTSDGRRVPFSAIVGNWPKPGPGQPALLSHDDVVTFFHEFGHNLAALLATAPYETLSSGFRQDFVEAPSQMLENFVWQPSVLKKISSNWKTGKPLPDALIAKMIAAKYVDYAYFTTRQIQYATVDMDYHTMGPHVDTTAVWAKVQAETTPTTLYPGTHPQAAFGHLFGYDAGYYSYLWALVYAQDMFTAFQRGGVESKAVGARYRKDILEPARTYEPDVEVTRFLGRPMSPAAFYAIFGIKAPPKG